MSTMEMDLTACHDRGETLEIRLTRDQSLALLDGNLMGVVTCLDRTRFRVTDLNGNWWQGMGYKIRPMRKPAEYVASGVYPKVAALRTLLG